MCTSATTGTARDALDAATAAPHRYVPVPLRLLAGGPATPGGAEPIELVAAVRRRVREHAARAAGAPVIDALIVVPAGWGPRRRSRLRQATHRAGLSHVEPVDAATALARHHFASPPDPVPDGAAVLVRQLICHCAAMGRRPGDP